jgi:uncharacterized membrane protein
MVNAVTPAVFPIPQAATPDTSLFSATLLPHRSLSRKGFLVLMALVGLVCFISGLAFAMIGAWPVFGFFGLDILLVYIAFRMNYRAARMFESINLSEDELRITRVHPSGRSESWSFNPYWVRFELREFENGADEMSLTSHGRKLIFGAFLSDIEKKDFASAFRDALAAQRTAPALR